MSELPSDERACQQLLALWNIASENAQLLFLRELQIPFTANHPVDSAKQALLNLSDLEWIEVCDWLAECHWLPPGA
jgi:hypothetical protein